MGVEHRRMQPRADILLWVEVCFSPRQDHEFIEFIEIMHVGHGHALPQFLIGLSCAFLLQLG